MSFLTEDDNIPTGPVKFFYFNWALVLLICTVASIGFLLLYSVGGGDLDRWAEPQMERFAIGLALMFIIGFIPLKVWKFSAPVLYGVGVALLIGVALFGEESKGAQRWLQIGPVRAQPSELMKIAVVMMLAFYYDLLPRERVSRPFWVILPLAIILVPTALVLKQPDLGTSLMLAAGGGVVMLLAGVSLWYFAGAITALVGLIWAVFASEGKSWQLLDNYQYDRINIFLNPALDLKGDGYQLNQAKIALGSGGVSGRGYLQGSQSQLQFLPDQHTDFIFTALAEEFGFIGSVTLLTLYGLIILFALVSMLQNQNRFGALVTGGLASVFFFFFALNMAMVMGLAPVVGLPLPLVSYGGTAMMVLMVAFGIIQSAHVHRPRGSNRRR
ncbi:rod shape-determining protein RodA [Paracoccaceae bacterium GXU_MW_L88]